MASSGPNVNDSISFKAVYYYNIPKKLEEKSEKKMGIQIKIKLQSGYYGYWLLESCK